MCVGPPSSSMMTMNPCPRLRRSASSRLRLGLGTALALCATLPLAGSAHASATQLVPTGSGMTMPAGIAETPDGSIWVSDSAMGVCRVDTSDPAGLVTSDYCAPEPTAAAEATPKAGPSASFQMAFDPISENFFVAEGSSKGAGIWRMHWNALNNVIDAATQVVFAGENRVFALAMGSIADDPSTPEVDPKVYVDFNGRDDATIHRLDDAANATPVDISATPIVGVSGTRGVVSMANFDGALYLAESAGVTRIATPGPAGPSAESVPGFPVDAGVPNALAADVTNDRVYAGTANADGVDRVDVLRVGTGNVSTYETGFALVTGLGVRASGDLLVADDPLASAGAPESLGQSRLLEVALQDTNMPAVTITSGPGVYSSATSASFAFSSVASASFTCSLDGSGSTACDDPTGPTGAQSYPGLVDGVHVFEVRASAGGRPARYTFIVDTVAPTVSVDNPASDKITDRDSLRARFSSNEFGVTYACTLDGQPVHGCTPPVWLRGFAIGSHAFNVTPTDLAGNVGATVAWTFERIPVPTPPAKPDNSGPGSASSPAPPAGTDSSGPGPAAESTASSIVPAACRALAGQKAKGSYRLAGRRLTVRITPTAGARYAKLTLRPRGRAKGRTMKIAVKAVTGTKARTLRIVLTKAQAARLRPRSRTMLTVGYGTCAATIGAATELTAPAKKSPRR